MKDNTHFKMEVMKQKTNSEKNTKLESEIIWD